MTKILKAVAFVAAASSTAQAADPIPVAPKVYSHVAPSLTSVKGKVSVIDGRTLWFPAKAQKVRLADIDACELPQWALDPVWKDRAKVKAPSPVPCGPLAKAWLKRTIGLHPVDCQISGVDSDVTPIAFCAVSGRDLGLEMLRVGWARVATPYPRLPQYLSYQTSAMAARYGMWATYVLDMNEWRRRAIDKTDERQPIADFNLLATRQSEISPPFADARNKPHRTDR